MIQKLLMKLLEIISYFDLFDYPLRKEDVLSFNEIKGDEWRDEKLEMKNGFYFLKGRSEIIKVRQKREKYAEKLWKKTRFYMKFLKMVPFLKMVAVCNTLAFNHPEKDSDIDLFIVTTKNRLWIARVWTTFVLQILGVRRHGNKVAGRFCLSFWSTEEGMDLEKIQIKPQDPYLAFWCLTLQPVLDNEMYNKFVEKNSGWIEEKYGLRFPKKVPFERGDKPPQGGFNSSFIARFFELFLKGKVGDCLENKLKNKLRPRAEAKAKKAGAKASIIISDTMLKFHNRDKRKEVYEKWKGALKIE